MSETMVHPETGEKLIRDVRPFKIRYEGRERTVDLPGWYPAKKGADGLHVGDDMDAADRALVELKAEVQGVLKPDEVRAIRRASEVVAAQGGRNPWRRSPLIPEIRVRRGAR